MLFEYTYRSSDGLRHTAEIEAENRDAAFAKVRAEMGVKPIKVVASGMAASSKPSPKHKLFTIHHSLFLAAIAAAAAAAIAAWLLSGARAARPYQVMTPQGPATYTPAQPLPRQTIPGDRRRIEAALRAGEAPGGGAASAKPPRGPRPFAAEAWLARYAEPGRAAPPRLERPSAADFAAALREPIRIASTDFTEVVDLKRIVAGMKLEMGAYIAGGGTADGYLDELEKRQRLELSYRESAERRLAELLKGQPSEPPGASAQRKRAAYTYWLKANASLRSMGIYEMPLPDSLRALQTSLEIDE